MHIDETQFPIEPAWEGVLAPPADVFATRGEELPRVSLGRPTWWSDQKMLGEKWAPPAGGPALRAGPLRLLAPAPRAADGAPRRVHGLSALQRDRAAPHRF